MHMLAPEKSHLPLFMNRNGQKLTRAGVTYILNKYAKAASVIDPSVPEKIPPHLMRHTKAMHIYDADTMYPWWICETLPAQMATTS